MPPVRAVIFDLDDTLFDDAGCTLAGLNALAAQHPALAALPQDELFGRHATTKNESAARALIGAFARRAWRRLVAPAELDRLARLYRTAREDGEGFEAGGGWADFVRDNDHVLHAAQCRDRGGMLI